MRINHLVLASLLAFLPGSTLAPQANSLVQGQTFDLTIQYVESIPDESSASYNVDVYLTLLDESGNPVQGLTTDSFIVQEEEGGTQKVEVQTISGANDRSINLVLVMDTSTSMQGTSITDAKKSAASFISSLIGPNDQAAFIIFDDVVRPQVYFTEDPAVIVNKLDPLNATPNSGSCLYDAAYSAIDVLSDRPTGNRAVILFTDSKDETPNFAICSKYKMEDVITLATVGAARTPVYTIGLGAYIDKEALQALADQTGGLYLYSPEPSQIANTFQTLEDRLRSQYVLRYSSSLSPGPHKLTISLDQLGPVIKDEYDFLLPPLPTHIKFLSPNDGDTVSGQLKISVSLTAPTGTSIDRVEFLVNGLMAGSDETKPYEVDLDTSQYPTGVMAISAIAYDPNNAELARNTLNLTLAAPTSLPMPSPAVETQNLPPSTPAETNNPIALLAIIMSGLSIVTISLLIFFLLRQQKQTATAMAVESYVESKPMPATQGIPLYHQPDEEKIKSNPETDALGALTIEASDDTSMIGQRFEITTPLITLGRSADNDLNFPNDKPVSRHHAEIYQISGKLYLRQVEMADASGSARPPKYGTYLNKSPMGADAILLKNGDEIQLGKRVRLKFESYTLSLDANMMTIDDNDLTNADDLDKTHMQ